MKKIEIEMPIYRAKKIDSDEYVVGNLIEDEGVFYIIKNPVVTHFNGLQQLTGECEYLDRVDQTTLAIHFNDMLDSKGNKIFASLSEDGKGGDILEWTIFPDDMPKLRINGVPYYSKGGVFKVTGRIEMMWHLLAPHRECKTIGIQE